MKVGINGENAITNSKFCKKKYEFIPVMEMVSVHKGLENLPTLNIAPKVISMTG